MIKKIYNVLDKIRSASIIIIFAWVILLCLLQVVLRYFTGKDIRPFVWGDEMIRMSSIWVMFLAASVGVKKGSHLSVEFFIKKYVPEKFINVVKKLATMIVIFILGTIVYYGVIHTITIADSTLQTLPISSAYFYAAIPTGCFYLIVEYLLVLFYGKNPFVQNSIEEVSE